MFKKLCLLFICVVSLNAEPIRTITYQSGVDWLPANRGYIKYGIDTFLNCLAKYEGKECPKELTFLENSIFVFPKGFFDTKSGSHGYIHYVLLEKPIDPIKSRIKYKIDKTDMGFDGFEAYENNQQIFITNQFDIQARYTPITTDTGYVRLMQYNNKNPRFTLDIYYGEPQTIDSELAKSSNSKVHTNLKKILDIENTTVDQDKVLRVIGFTPASKEKEYKIPSLSDPVILKRH